MSSKPHEDKNVFKIRTGTLHYMRVQKTQFHFNAIDQCRPVSINSTHFNVNYLLTNRDKHVEV
jgi:hypothetical protein